MMYGRMCSALRTAAGRPVALGATMLAMAGAPALAQQQQQQRGQWEQEQRWNQREQQVGRSQQYQLGRQQDRLNQDRYGQEQFRQDQFSQDQFRQSSLRQQQPGMGQMGGQPSNWVRIDVDVNNDGNPDGVEYIHIADLRRALAMSDSRMQREGGMGDFQQTQRSMQMDREFQSQRTQPRQDRWQQQQSFQQDWQQQDFQQDRFQQDRFQQDPRYRTQGQQFRQQQQTRPQQWQQRGEWEQWETYRESDSRRQPMQRQGGMMQDEYYRGGFEQEARGSSMQQGMGAAQTVRGEIRDLNTVRLAGVQDRHVIATIQTDRGQTAHVDLGPENKLRELDLNQGSNIELRGTSGQINDRPVLMATQIRSEGRTLNVTRTAGLGSVDKFDGEVVQAWDDTLQHDNRVHTLALVRLDQGRTVVVDFGPSQQLRRVDLSKGDKVSILGEQGRIDGRNALLAKSVAKNGNSVNIDRMDKQRDLRTQQGLPQQDFQQRGVQQQEFEEEFEFQNVDDRYNMNR